MHSSMTLTILSEARGANFASWLEADVLELCWKMGDAARSGGAGFGDIVHGDAVGELDAFDELGQLIPPVQPPPGL